MSSARTTAQAAGLLLAGAVTGGFLAVTFSAAASSPAASSPGPASYAATGPAGGAPDGTRGPRPPLQAGTVTAVGPNSVSIKATGAAKTYAVDANSDIDKNGEAQLSDLKVGDAVHFAVRPGTSTIAVVHAGDEAKNRPAFGPDGRGPGGPCPGGAGRHHGPGDGDGPAPTTAPTSGA
jgi:hypothetical protein